jgi:hypothetical protein
MTATQSTQRRGATWWRAVCRAAAALRAIHDEQVLMWELAWNHVPSPDQSQAVTGTPCPGPTTAAAAGQPGQRLERK